MDPETAVSATLLVLGIIAIIIGTKNEEEGGRGLAFAGIILALFGIYLFSLS